MSFDKRQFAVNWQDGMKVRTDHFKDLEKWVVQSIQDAIINNRQSYGILPSLNGSESTLNLQCELLPGDEIKVVLQAIRAVTAGGLFIERRDSENAISGMTWIETRRDISTSKKEQLDVIVGVDITGHQPISDPDPDEMPPRRPFATPKYSLKIVESGTPYHPEYELKIGEIVFESEAPVISKSYIPPCTCMTSHPLLIEEYEKTKTLLHQLQMNAIKATEILSRESQLSIVNQHDKDLLKQFSSQVSSFFANTLSNYDLILKNSPPIYWIEYFIRLARILKTTLESWDSSSSQAVLTWLQNNVPDFTKGEFEDVLQRLLSMDYIHTAVREPAKQINLLLHLLMQIFNTSSRIVEPSGPSRTSVMTGFKEKKE